MSATHAQLCALAVRWLKRPNSGGGHGCMIAISEARPETAGEAPDAIGFRAGHQGGSVLVECKVSRADFLADRAKPHRRAGAGMGTWRYYLAPAGVIAVEDLPERWGLLEVNARGHIKALAGPAALSRNSGTFYKALDDWRHAGDPAREQALLVRLLARVGDPEALNLQIRVALSAQNRMALTVADLREELRAEQGKRANLANQLDATFAFASQVHKAGAGSGLPWHFVREPVRDAPGGACWRVGSQASWLE